MNEYRDSSTAAYIIGPKHEGAEEKTLTMEQLEEAKRNVERINRSKAIKLKCLDCMCGQLNEVKLCPCADCSLYPFRLGKDPYRKPMSEEEKKTRANILNRGKPTKVAETPL